MNINRRSILLLFACSLICLGHGARAQQRPVWDYPSFDPSGALKLTMQGESGSHYALEASADLQSWWKLSSSIAAAGKAEFLYRPSPTYGTRYFRARMETPLPPLNVTVQSDTNITDLAALTSVDSSLLSITNDNGLQYTLTLPTNAVTDPQVVYMTTITNLPGLPFSAGFIGAINLTPAGLYLQQPAQLEISFPTNSTVDPRSVVAFTFNDDGTYLHLWFGFADTNRISIPVFKLNGFGCAAVTASEFDELSQRPTGDTGTNGVGLQGLPSAHQVGLQYYPLVDCPPGAFARSVQVDKIIEASYVPLISAIGTAAHQLTRPASSTSSDPRDWGIDWLGNDQFFWDDFYFNQIQPYLLEGEKNCQVNQDMVEKMTSLNALEASFHVPHPHGAVAEGSLCLGIENCIVTIDHCCSESGWSGQAAVKTARDIAAQSASYECPIPQSLLDKVGKDCQSNWSGSLYYFLTETVISSSGDALGIESFTRRTHLVVDYETDKNGLTGNSSSGLYFGLVGQVDASVLFGYNLVSIQTDNQCCSPCVYTVVEKGGKIIGGKAMADLSWVVDQSVIGIIPPGAILSSVLPLQDLTAQSGVPVHRTATDVTYSLVGPKGDGRCEGKTQTIRTNFPITLANYLPYQNNKKIFLGTPTHFVGEWGDTNVVNNDPNTTTTTSVRVNWDFSKN
jgi:hypothetical protein